MIKRTIYMCCAATALVVGASTFMSSESLAGGGMMATASNSVIADFAGAAPPSDPCAGKPDGELSVWNIPLGSNKCGARKCKDGKTLNPPAPVDVTLPKTEGTPPNEKTYKANCGDCGRYLCDHGYPGQCASSGSAARSVSKGGDIASGCGDVVAM